ncbi:GatB/YqeY domain-containing protein [Amycolatopsis sp. NBC_00345]|uniref:GatB/YqeY domain-containing protein n=1 Tax=Amycolatopsis sp. NBC_00345 TaxID=2975955 RepID=UPI002E265DF1
MRTNLRRALTTAMKNRDRAAITALRSALAAIDNAESVPAEHLPSSAASNEHVAGAAVGLGAAEVERRHLTEADVRSIVEKEAVDRVSAADEYERLGRADLAANLRAEAEVLDRQLHPES